MTSPEQGAQHECSNTFFWPPGGTRSGLAVCLMVFMVSGYQTWGRFSSEKPQFRFQKMNKEQCQKMEITHRYS
jgi:hypothetical protein